jgi:hypothetical protein
MNLRAKVTVLVLGAVVAAGGYLVLTALPTSAGEGNGSEFTGSRQCMACHRSQHEQWREMKHSRAWESLTPEQARTGKDPNGKACISCHATGFWDPMGFSSAEETPLLKGVGCEACHGAGKEHIKTMIKAALNEVEPDDKRISLSLACSRCHNPHVDYRKLYGSETPEGEKDK